MLIITADDFGFSPSRNEAILAAAFRGRVSAASLLVNMPYADEACQQVQQHVPKLGIGLHFNLTSGSCVAPPESIPLLVDELGMFRSGFFRLWRCAGRPDFREQIAIEFEAQHQKMLQLRDRFNLRVDHLDSHQHIHAIRAIREIMEPVAEEQRVILRVPREIMGAGSSPIGMLKKAVLSRCTRGVPHRVGYFGVLYSGAVGPEQWERIRAKIAADPSLPYEVNVHPGMLQGHEADGEAVLCSTADRKFHRSEWRVRELDTLLDPEFAEDLRHAGLFPLASFQDIAP